MADKVSYSSPAAIIRIHSVNDGSSLCSYIASKSNLEHESILCSIILEPVQTIGSVVEHFQPVCYFFSPFSFLFSANVVLKSKIKI